VLLGDRQERVKNPQFDNITYVFSFQRDPDQGFREQWYAAPLERSGNTIDM
jgi:hypothetical protein